MVTGTQRVEPLGKKYSFPPEPRMASSRTRRNDQTEAFRRRTSLKKERRTGSFSMARTSKAAAEILVSLGSLRYIATRSRSILVYSGLEKAITTNQKPVGSVLACKLVWKWVISYAQDENQLQHATGESSSGRFITVFTVDLKTLVHRHRRIVQRFVVL